MNQMEQFLESLDCTLVGNIWVHLEDKMIGKVSGNTIILWDSTISKNALSEPFRKKLQLIGFTSFEDGSRGSFLWKYSVQVNNTMK